MQAFYFILGVIIVAITVGDFFYSTVSFNGAGIISRYFSSAIADGFLWINKKTKSRTFFRFSGMTHILSLIILWLGLLWAGFFLMLMGDVNAVLHASTGVPAGVVSKFYFSGYILSTLGNGQYIPAAGAWQIVVAVFSFMGFIFITTAMTYLMNLTSAVIHKRNLGLFISNLGETPEEIIINTYSGEGFSRLVKVVPTLQQMINKHNQNHFAHPGVHYFYSVSRAESLSINLTNLDEVLTIVEHHVKMEQIPEQDIRPLRDALDKFLNTVQRHFVAGFDEETGNVPDLQQLQAAEIPVDGNIAVNDSQELKNRRALLLGLLQSNGWSWEDIYSRK